jgi:hypothetical protein
MNILYIADNYANNVCGTKVSIYNEMRRRGYNLIWKDKNILSGLWNSNSRDKISHNFKSFIIKNDIKMIWLCHSGLIVNEEIKDWCYKRGIVIIGVGMSDPYYFDAKKRFPYYDIYISNSLLVSGKYRCIIPTIYNPTACDFTFHKKMNVRKKYYTSIIGRGLHPRFNKEDMRLIDVGFLRKNNIDVHTFGNDWFKPRQNHDNNSVFGEEFLKVINMTNLGLDLQDTFSPLAHRMMEYSACGTPVITRKRKEVTYHFTENKDILFYESHKDLLSKVKYYLKNKDKLEAIGNAARETCLKRHDIVYRVNNIVNELNTILGEKIL